MTPATPVEQEPEIRPWMEPREPEAERFPEEPYGGRESEEGASTPEEAPRSWEPMPQRERPESPRGGEGEGSRELRYGRRPRDGRNRPPREPRADKPEASEITREEPKSPAGESAPWVASHLHTDP